MEGGDGAQSPPDLEFSGKGPKGPKGPRKPATDTNQDSHALNWRRLEGEGEFRDGKM